MTSVITNLLDTEKPFEICPGQFMIPMLNEKIGQIVKDLDELVLFAEQYPELTAKINPDHLQMLKFYGVQIR